MLCRFGWVVAVWALVAHAAPFTYETPTELLNSGDFNGDGRIDAVIVDRATGNARVGLQNAGGGLNWLAGTPTGVPNATGLAVGRFLQTTRHAIAVTSPEHNRVTAVGVSGGGSSELLIVGVGPHTLAGVRRPHGIESSLDYLAIGSAHNSGPQVHRMELYNFNNGSSGLPFGTGALLQQANPVDATWYDGELVGGLLRGVEDTFVAYTFYAPQSVITVSNLPLATHWVSGRFNGEELPRLLFYVPGHSNVFLHSLTGTSEEFIVSPPTEMWFSAAIEQIYYIDEQTNGSVMLRFGEGVAGARVPPGGSGLVIYSHFSATGGNVPNGVIPLGMGKFAMLSGNSTHAQIFTLNGADYTQTSASDLPAVTRRSTRANIWLFRNEPFVAREPGFVSSYNGGDWIAEITSLMGGIFVTAESDRGATAGLGDPGAANAGPAPAGAPHGIANQYHPAISLFSYNSARPPASLNLQISPAPGHYLGPITVTISSPDAGAYTIYYRKDAAQPYQAYGGAFLLSENAQVQFYAQRSTGERSALQVANYTFRGSGIPPIIGTDPVQGTNPPSGTIDTNVLSPAGTVFYARHGNTPTIWSINLDGTGDHYITDGWRPRVTPDGRYMAFMRGPNTYLGQGSIWVRDFESEQEFLLRANTNLVNYYDWDFPTLSLILDWDCLIRRLDLSGNFTVLWQSPTCRDDAPVINPVDGRIAYHNLHATPASGGIWVAPPDFSSSVRVAPDGRWPAWSPDGQRLAICDGDLVVPPDTGRSLYIVNANGSGGHQITGPQNRFPHGAVWSPDGASLVAAGYVDGVNGIWILPLNTAATACSGPPRRLPTTDDGNVIDVVGSIIVAPPPPDLTIHREAGRIVVSWRKTVYNYTLESSPELIGTSWAPVTGPFALVNGRYELTLPAAPPESMQYYRLARP